jgi:hypothetical protein
VVSWCSILESSSLKPKGVFAFVHQPGAYVQAEDMTKAEAIAKVMAKNNAMERIEIVCAEAPPVTRSVSFDVESGEITKAEDKL